MLPVVLRIVKLNTDILVPPEQVRDTVDLYNLERQRKLSLRFLTSHLLNRSIQSQTHCSAEDAKAVRTLRNSNYVSILVTDTALDRLWLFIGCTRGWLKQESWKIQFRHFIELAASVIGIRSSPQLKRKKSSLSMLKQHRINNQCFKMQLKSTISSNKCSLLHSPIYNWMMKRSRSQIPMTTQLNIAN